MGTSCRWPLGGGWGWILKASLCATSAPILTALDLLGHHAVHGGGGGGGGMWSYSIIIYERVHEDFG